MQLPPCKGCDRPLRPRGVKSADAPGTQKYQPGGLCPKCYDSAPKRGKPRAVKCSDCNRRLRPVDKTLQEMPGTVTHRGGGRCTSCWRLDKGVTAFRKDTRPTNCKSCNVKLRPNHADPAAYPGAIRHAGKGICVRCKSALDSLAGLRMHKPKKATPTVEAPAEATPEPVVIPGPPKEEPLPEITDPGALRFHRERQERRKKAERLRAAKVGAEEARRRFLASRRVA